MHMPTQQLQPVTILLIFLVVALIQIFLISLLIIFIKKIKDLLLQKSKPYYYCILFYIASKMSLCVILEIRIITGVATNWDNISGQLIQTFFKVSIIFAQFTMVLLFLIAFNEYMVASFEILQYKHLQKLFKYALKIISLVIILLLVILSVLFIFSVIGYNIVNMICVGFNCCVIFVFLGSFFYLNFEMTGVMIQSSINEAMKKIYKILIILFFSRMMTISFELFTFFAISNGSYLEYIHTLEQNNNRLVIYAITFISCILFVFLTQGIPLISSLKASTVRAFNKKFQFQQSKQFQNLQKALLDSASNCDKVQIEKDNQEIVNFQFKSFNIQQVLHENSIMKILKASLGDRMYIIKEIKGQVSSYIKEDIQADIDEINKLNIKIMNKVFFFQENSAIYLIQKYRPLDVNQMSQKCINITQKLKLALTIAFGIEKIHANEVVYGSLKPKNILFDNNQNVYFINYGFTSLKKYLALTAEYSNKSLYTAVQLLNDKNLIVLHPKKASDIYSFGMILYQIVTKTYIYRDLSLKEIKQKFCNANFRPKIPQNLDHNLKNLIRKCWQDNPIKRPSIEEIIDILKKLIQ